LRYLAAASKIARSGSSPTISLFWTLTPCPAARSLTSANTRAGDVTSMSSRFMETWALPPTSNPLAWTAGRPPLEVRIALAISLKMG